MFTPVWTHQNSFRRTASSEASVRFYDVSPLRETRLMKRLYRVVVGKMFENCLGNINRLLVMIQLIGDKGGTVKNTEYNHANIAVRQMSECKL